MGQMNQNGEYPIEGGHMDGQSIKYDDPPDYFTATLPEDAPMCLEKMQEPCDYIQTEVRYERHVRGHYERWWYIYKLAE